METTPDEPPAPLRQSHAEMKRVRAAFACLLLAVASVICVSQLWTGNLVPLAVALPILAVAWWCRPSLWIICVLVPVSTLTVLGADAFLFHHRLAVGLRAWSAAFGSDRVEDSLRSPSGRTTIYIVGSHWIDSRYRAYISDGGLFPKRVHIATKGGHVAYPRDLAARWNDGVFTVTEQFLALRYTEDSGIVETFMDAGS